MTDSVQGGGAPVRAEAEGRVGIIELTRPEKFNCLSSEVLTAVEGALGRYEGDSGIRVVLIRSQGKNFCAGADLDEVLKIRQDRAALTRFIERGHRVFCRFEASRLPVVAAVQGLCLAGGMELLLSCDVIFAGALARLGDQHAQYGLVPGWGGSQRLPRIVGLRRALDLFYSHRWLPADEAKQWGLVNTVVPDEALWREALAYCRALAEKSPAGIAAMKKLAREAMEGTLGAGLALERNLAVEHLLGPDTAEGLAAFGQRRKPAF